MSAPHSVFEEAMPSRPHHGTEALVLGARGVLLALTGLAVAACGLGDPEPSIDPDAPRQIVLLSIDTLRPDFLGAYGAEYETPAIDRLAADGVVFDDVWAQATSTLRSHKSILYSLYPSVHRAGLETVTVEEPTSPVEALAAAGLSTAAIVEGGQLREEFGLSGIFQDYEVFSRTDLEEQGVDVLAEVEERAKGWIAEHADEPFFLLLHTYEVHCPYDPPAPDRARLAGWYEGDPGLGDTCGRDLVELAPTLTDEQWRYLRDLYAGEVARVDRFVGSLVDTLRQEGLYDDMVFILMSDHGESLGENDYAGHNRLYDEQLQIPLIVKLPGVPAATVYEPVESIDVMPTLFDLLGLDPPYPFQGDSLLPLLDSSAGEDGSGSPDADPGSGRAGSPERGSGQKPGRRDVRIAEGLVQVAVERGGAKLVARIDADGVAGTTLYRTSGRSGERLASRIASQNSRLVEALADAYRRVLEDSRELADRFVVEERSRLEWDEKTLEDLRALGYVQ